MDIIKEFENYLPIWSEKKMQPIPTPEHPDRWAEAWKDYVDEYLAEKHDEIVEEYLSMEFKTRGEAKMEKQEKAKPEVQEIVEEPIEEKSQTAWDRIQAMRKDLN